MLRFLRTTLFSLRHYIYPPRCALCDAYLHNEGRQRVCTVCEASLRRLDADFNAPHIDTIWFDRARSLFPFEGRIRDTLHGLKYEQRFDVVKVLAGYLSEEAKRMGRFDIIMPVPLHPKRLKSRGYNQAVLLARPMANKLKCIFDPHSLFRTRAIGPQVGRELAERLTAVRNIFAVRDRTRVEKKHILLIDDVLTTGATVNECARTLKKAKAATVCVLTVARPL